jgi:CBS domain containing-hemolysin-like protein
MMFALLTGTVIAMVLLSGFFAGSETGVYRFSRFHLRLGMQQHKPFFALLGDVLSDSRGYILSALIGNNLSNYVATSLVTYMILRRTGSDHTAEFYATVIMTPALFLFADIIPKSVYYLHANAILPRIAPLLWFFHRLFSHLGAVALLKWISDTLSRLFHLPSDAADVITAGQRTQIKQIISETRDEGIVSAFQKDIMSRAVDIPAMPVQAVMIPAAHVVMVDVQTDAAALREVLKSSPYTRLPVYEHDRDHLVGFINICQVLAESERFGDLRQFLRPIGRLGATTSVLDAITFMRKGNFRMMFVASPRHPEGKPDEKVIGIVTMKDLIEELTGELTPW